MSHKDKIKNIAIDILEKSNVAKVDNSTFDPLTILMIISVILTCIRIIQECNKSKLSNMYQGYDKYAFYGTEIKELSYRRTWFTKMRIKKILRKEMNTDDYSRYSIAITNTLLDKGETITDDDIQTLVEMAHV